MKNAGETIEQYYARKHGEARQWRQENGVL